ncbi:ABC-three component system protein [Solibacillus silvestris]|uniref:ABC-three component system protein n=1 Tax=Solibacillus silvestris TaxID=76853 RepID=UPI003F81B57F
MVNTAVEKKVEFDATHSWNGFCYQGKVAIIAVIDYMINSIENIELINQHSLEFEYLEDFSIIKDENYVQIHQVKSYGVDSLSNYRDAIWLLLGKSVYGKYKTIKKAYLHAAERIESNGKTISDIDTLKKALLASKAPSSSNSSTQMSPLELFKYVKENELVNEAFKKFSIYEYSSGDSYCTLLNIEELTKKKIEEYYEFTDKKQELEQKGLLNEYIESVYVTLLGFIDKHINIRHYNRQTAVLNYDKKINLTDIKDILDENYENLPKSYYVYYLKDKIIQNFNSYYNENMDFIQNEYIKFQHDKEIIIQYQKLENGINKVSDLIKKVFTELSEEEFLLFCHKMNPHVKVNYSENLMNLNDLVKSDFLEYPWLLSLVEFHENIVGEDLTINIENSHFLATTIIHTLPTPTATDGLVRKRQMNANIEATISKIAISILENNKIYEALYKIDYIITGNINKSLKDYIPKTTVYKEYELPENSHHIMAIKNIDLIDIKACELRRDRSGK